MKSFIVFEHNIGTASNFRFVKMIVLRLKKYHDLYMIHSNIFRSSLAALYVLCVSSFVRNRYRHGHTNVGSGNENASDVFDARDFGGFFTTCIHLHYS